MIKHSEKKMSDEVLKGLNLALGIAHGGQAVQMLIMYLVRNADYTTTATVESGPDKINTYPLPAVATTVPIPSAIAHFVQYFEFDTYKKNLEKGENLIRWIEYSVSNPIIYWVLAQMSRVRDISTLLGTSISISATQLMAANTEKSENFTMPLVATWISFLASFAVIFGHWIEYFDVLDDFAWITFSLLVLFAGYLVALTLWKLQQDKDNYRNFEIAYMLLTAVTRTIFIQYLAWGEWFIDANWTAP